MSENVADLTYSDTNRLGWEKLLLEKIGMYRIFLALSKICCSEEPMTLAERMVLSVDDPVTGTFDQHTNHPLSRGKGKIPLVVRCVTVVHPFRCQTQHLTRRISRSTTGCMISYFYFLTFILEPSQQAGENVKSLFDHIFHWSTTPRSWHWSIPQRVPIVVLLTYLACTSGGIGPL